MRVMKPIVELINGKQTRVFTSMQQIKECGLDYRYVRMCASGKKQSYKGKQYIYKQDINNIKVNDLNKPINMINKYNKEGKLIKQYKTIHETIYDGHNNKLVSRSLISKGKIKHDNHIWLYESDKDILEQLLNNTPKHSKKVIMMDNGKIVHKFSGIWQARQNGYYDNGIKYSIANNIPYLGFTWKIL